jgi:hypothetical protein
VAEDGKTEILGQKECGAMNCYLMVVGLIITFLGVSGFAQTKTTTSHATTLAQVHAIYVEPMANGFDQYLAGDLVRRLPKGITITNNKKQADAVLAGTGRSPSHGISRTVNQAIGLGGSASGAVELLAQDGTILWADTQTDNTIPFFGIWRHHGMDKVASRVAKALCKALKKAEKATAKS